MSSKWIDPESDHYISHFSLDTYNVYLRAQVEHDIQHSFEISVEASNLLRSTSTICFESYGDNIKEIMHDLGTFLVEEAAKIEWKRPPEKEQA